MRFSQSIQVGRTDSRYTDFEKMVSDWPKERLEFEVSLIQNKRSTLTKSQRDRILDLHNKLK